MIPVQLKKLHQDATLPAYGTPGAAAIDLRAILTAATYLAPGATTMIGTGIAIHISDPAYCAKIYPRSGLGAKGLILANGVGLIDSDYQGEIMCCIWNRSMTGHWIEPLERIAQMTFESVEHACFQEVSEFVSSERGTGAFGHSGRM